MFRSCLSRQINEVEILKSMFCGEGELKVWDEEQYAKLKEDVANWEDDTPQFELQLHLSLDPPYPQDATFSINVTMPAFYPSSDIAEIQVSVPQKILSQEKEQHLSEAAGKFVASKMGQECVLELVQFIKEWIFDNAPPAPPAPQAPPPSQPIPIKKPPPPSSPAGSPASGTGSLGASKGLVKPVLLEPKEQEFRRILLWFSTIAPDRAKILSEWAKQLGLTGISRLGSPAILLVEGPKPDVDEYVSSLRSYRWKKMDIVCESQYRCSKDCRRFTQFKECMLSLPELQPIFRNAGLEEMYKEGLKIRGF